jgi:hypothetical protein
LRRLLVVLLRSGWGHVSHGGVPHPQRP